jgi:diguanylate cyclase (GGDEF)-like protein/PAS domain S-box-containing protein
MKKKKNRLLTSKTDKFQLIGMHAFFLLLACIAAMLFVRETLNLKTTIANRLKAKAISSASNLSSSIKNKINAHFHDLKFLRADFLNVNDGHLNPTLKSLDIFKNFQKSHPGIAAINIIDNSVDKVVWSSSRIYYGLDLKNVSFVRLGGYANRYIGSLYLQKKNKQWVIPMNERIVSTTGHTLGFIGSPFVLSDLSVIHTSQLIQSIVLETASGKVISVWKNGRWFGPGAKAPNFYGAIKKAVKGFPWLIKAGWTKSAVEKIFWSKERFYTFILLLFLLVLIVIDTVFNIAFLRLMRLRNYQEAAISAQEDVLLLKDTQTIYQHTTDIIVNKTDAIASVLMVPDIKKEFFIPVAACADNEEYKKALMQIRPSMKSGDIYGNMPASIVYREKKHLGPFYKFSPDVLNKYPFFIRIKSLMVFPIFENFNSEPVAVLGIQSDSKHYFTKGMVNLLKQLVNSLGIALNQLRINGNLAREAEHQHRLTEFNLFLAQMNQLISKTYDESILLNSICYMAIEYAKLKLVWIAKPDEDGNIRFISHYGISGFVDSLNISVLSDIPEGQSSVGRAWRSKKAVYIPSFKDDILMRSWQSRNEEFGILSSASIPIFRNGDIWAVITVLHSEENFFDEELKNLMEEIALDIGFGLDRIDLVNREKKATETSNAFLSNTSAGITLASYPDRVFLEANETFLNILGYPDIGALQNHNSREVYPDDETYKRIGNLAQKILTEGRGSERDIPVSRRDGTIIYADFYGQKLKDTIGGKEQILWTLVDITERHRLSEELSYQASYDELTGLHNRRSLLIEMERAMARAERRKTLAAFAVIDLDDFKPINDTYGHNVGDGVLKIVSGRLKEILRKTDFTARLGGDEFVLIIEDFQNKIELENIFEKIEKKIKESIILATEMEFKIGLSMGVYMYDNSSGGNKSITPETLLRYADHALYESKNNKNDRLKYYAFYGESLQHMENKMQKLLRDGNLIVYYQPIMDNFTREVVGLEALARLNDNGTIISPYNFLPMLNEKDLLYLSNEMLQKAFKEISEIGKPAEKLWISVNIDPKFISEEYLSSLKKILESGCEPSKIVLEILETGDFLGRDNAIKSIKTMKSYGVKVALDDVGSAYSSLMRLKELPVDKIKLDQFFVRTLEENPHDIHFVQSILELAEQKKVNLVVEGVETEDILDALSVMDVHQLQGYAIAMPMPQDKLKDFLLHKPLDHRRHPMSFLGLYAIKIVSYGNLKRLIKQDPYAIDYENIVNSKKCPIKEALLYLNVPENNILFDLHSRYDEALAALGRSLKSSGNGDWGHLEWVSDVFEREIITEYYRRKVKNQ